MAKSIKREQEVVVIAGSHKGKRGKVLEIMGNDRVLVEGVNMITKIVLVFFLLVCLQLHKYMAKSKKKIS